MSTPLPCILIIVLLEPAFLFFVLMSGRPLPVTTFFVFSKPLCSHFAAQIVIREFSATLQKRCLSLSKGFPLQPKFAAAAAQRFYSFFVALLEAILQRCSSAARFVQDASQCPRPIFIHSPTEHYYPATLFKLYLFLSSLLYGSSSVQMLYSFPATAMLLSTHTRKCQQLTEQTLF